MNFHNVGHISLPSAIKINKQSLFKMYQRDKGAFIRDPKVKIKSRKKNVKSWEYSILAGSGYGISSIKSYWKGCADAKEKDILEQITQAENAFKEGRIEEAEEMLESVVRESQEVTEAVRSTYDTLAARAYQQGDLRRAEQLVLQLVDKMLKGGARPDDNSLLGYSLKLARIYAQLGEHQLAQLGFKKCCAIQRNKYSQGDRDQETVELCVNCFFWYGVYLLEREEIQEAKLCFESALSMCPELTTIQPSQVMVLLYKLGEASFSGGQYDEALQHLLNAVVLGRATDSPELASYYTQIGLVYLAKGLGQEAASWCAQGRPSPESSSCLKQASQLLQPS